MHWSEGFKTTYTYHRQIPRIEALLSCLELDFRCVRRLEGYPAEGLGEFDVI